MIRKLARPMLATVFIADGVETLRNKDEYVDGARTVLAKARKVVPAQYSSFIPDSPKAAVTASAGTRVAAGSLFALGKFPRLSAGALAVTQVGALLARHDFWAEKNSEEKKDKRSGFVTDMGLLGGLVLATADTEGKPGLAWRAEHAGKQINKKVQAALPTKSEAEKTREKLQERTQEFTGVAKERAGQLAGAAASGTAAAAAFVDENKDDWKDTVSSFAENARETVSKVVEDARDKAADVAEDLDIEGTVKDVRASADKGLKTARETAKKQNKNLKLSRKQKKAIRKARGKAVKRAKKRAKAIRKRQNKGILAR